MALGQAQGRHLVTARRPAARVPFRTGPMLATLVEEPFHRPGWVYEEKYDGYRILAYKEGEARDPALAQREGPHGALRGRRARGRGR